MRSKLFYLAIVISLFAGCSREEIETPLESSVATANMETEDTKSFATDQGLFSWRDGDQITMTTEGGNVTGTLTGGEGTANGDFIYNASKLTGYALYPYNEYHVVTSADDITFVMPAEYNLGETVSNTNAPMLAVPYDGFNLSEPNYNFTHLGGVVRFIFNNAPAGTSKFTLSLGVNKINGTFKVNFENTVPQISTSDVVENSGSTLTTLKFDPLESPQDITLFVPVPVGNYTGFEAKLYQGDTVIGEWTKEAALNNIGRRALVLMNAHTFGNAGGSIDNNVNASNSNELIGAIGSTTDETTTVTMTDDIVLTESITIAENKEVVLNLNGYDLRNDDNMITVSEGATLHIVNNASAVETKASEVIDQATISSTTDIIKASAGAVINIGENVKLETSGEGSSCVWIPARAENVTVETYGVLSVTSAGAAVISHNGGLSSGTIKILGGEVSHTEDVAIYIAGNADVTIDNVFVSGTTAIEQRAGTLTINGGTFTATANEFKVIENANGTTTEGVAVAIYKHNTNYNLRATINGGTFTGKQSVYFNNNSSTNEVSLEIKGGVFSTNPSDHVAPGYAAIEENDSWQVVKDVVEDIVSVGSSNDLKNALNSLVAGNMVVLEKDIDLTGQDWIVSSPWQGSSTEVIFDGNNHKITGLSTTGLQGGLFGKFNSNGNITIKNLTLVDVTIQGTDVDGESAGGALIGWIENHGASTITIENVKVEGIKAEGFKYIGGLIGYNNGNNSMNLVDCSVTGNAESYLNSTYNENGNYKGHVGGLLGLWNKGSLTNCEVKDIAIKHGTNDMTGSYNRAGALVGTKYTGVNVVSATVDNVTVDGAEVTAASLFGPAASTATDSDKNNVEIVNQQ